MNWHSANTTSLPAAKQFPTNGIGSNRVQLWPASIFDAGIFLRQKNSRQALITAREIHSFGHLEELHLLRSEYYERLGICRTLHELKLSHQYRDSLLTAQNESMVYETQNTLRTR